MPFEEYPEICGNCANVTCKGCSWQGGKMYPCNFMAKTDGLYCTCHDKPIKMVWDNVTGSYDYICAVDGEPADYYAYKCENKKVNQ